MDITDDCTCGVCLELFTDPRILPCGHTYCQKCIEGLLAGSGQRSAQCPECRVKSKQPAMGFVVNYGLLGMVGKLKASIDTGTHSAGTPEIRMHACHSCGKSVPRSDMFSCTTCKENAATAASAEFVLCGTCIAKMHKGHDYQELEASNKWIKEALENVLECYEAYCENIRNMNREMTGIEAAIERFGNLLEDRDSTLAMIVDDLNSGSALTEPQLQGKLTEVKEIKDELEKGVFVTVFAALEECNSTLSEVLDLAAFADAEDRIKPRVVELPTTDGSLGFAVRGGDPITYLYHHLSSPIFISEITPGGAADQNGQLRRGDQLIAVNGINVENECQEGFMRIVKSAMKTETSVKLKVRYTAQLLAKILEENGRRIE